MQNLKLAFPDWTEKQRRGAIRGMARQLGWMAAEFAHFPAYTQGNYAAGCKYSPHPYAAGRTLRRNRSAQEYSPHPIERTVLLEGFENFQAAQAKGKGVLFLTGHMSAWELAPFAQALFGNPLHFLVRPIDNPRVDALITKYRCLSGNLPIDKNQSARAVLKALAENGTVGILADHNTLPSEGVFVDFFGIPACTTSGLARFALHTGAAVVPVFLRWDERIRKYRLCFEPAIELSRTGDDAVDIRENTQRFTGVIENYVRRYPDQWLWLHRRWMTRPAGCPPIYN